MRGSIIDYTAHMYSIQDNTSVWRENAQKEGTPGDAGGCMPGASLPGRPAGGAGGRGGGAKRSFEFPIRPCALPFSLFPGYGCRILLGLREHDALVHVSQRHRAANRLQVHRSTYLGTRKALNRSWASSRCLVTASRFLWAWATAARSRCVRPASKRACMAAKVSRASRRERSASAKTPPAWAIRPRARAGAR